ncbi:LpqB family beta-propeller domain-containing protein [Candidatus Blastococcus massiliensis]|uniref:LpqB family beta-propeller domain-containing protein n=1 Tax=Candidatus Blastococcus massiliensis TaxID=1470358 RepID=UPI0004B0919B|nr:LpqB family beta-propeller domain-containing protein [Candidatus Blastococcus massiliensis]
MRRRAGLPALGAAVLLGLTSCSIVPTSSPTVPITQAPERPARDVGIPLLSPAPGATPEEIVRGFIDASASGVRNHPVAREYLTPEAARSWSDAARITVIESDYAAVATAAGMVQVTAQAVGTVDARGSFAVATGSSESFTPDFQLAEVDGEWRIADPDDGLIMLRLDFERLYDAVDAYFLDPTGQELVPDPRYLIGGEAQPTALVERLLEGPSATLVNAVRNPLQGAQLARRVSVEGQTALVDLTDVEVDPATELCELCAQLTWSLTQLEAPRIRSVTISVDGEPVEFEGVPAQQTTEDWQMFDPYAAPVDAVGHYLQNGRLRTVDDEDAPGPAGTGFYGLTSAAVSTDARSGELTYLVGVRPEQSGESLWAGRYGGELQLVQQGGSRTLSAPTVARTLPEAWVVRDGSEVVRVAESEPVVQSVSVPSLAALGPAQVIELSPDGVRVAMIVADLEGAGARLRVGTVRRDLGEVYVRDLPEVAPGLSSVVDVAWRSSGELWVLAGDPGDEAPYSLGVDGWGLKRERNAGLPASPTSLGAAPGRPPLVVADDTLWQWSTGGTWVTLVRGREPIRGSAPFYPL